MIPTYVDDQNENHIYVAGLKEKIKSQPMPQIYVAHVLGEVIFGCYFAWTFNGLLPLVFFGMELPPQAFLVSSAVGSAIGVFIAGSSVTRQKGTTFLPVLGAALVGSIVVMLLELSSPNGGVGFLDSAGLAISFVGMIGFNTKGR
jgi:hypothetical protein